MNGPHTRTRIAADHALITAESHVPAPLVGWTHTEAVTLIAPVMGAGFVQALVRMSPTAESALPLPGVERFVFVLEGAVTLKAGTSSWTLESGGYAFVPAGADHRLCCSSSARLFLLEKRYIPLESHAPAPLTVGREQEVSPVPFLGDERARLRTLLPAEPRFDLAMNTFEFDPGASLPMVESHVMEHGLIFLDGGGVYRLGDAWYPVEAGDAIWMAPYLPQWFGCLGEVPARYLYYKDTARDPLLERRR